MNLRNLQFLFKPSYWVMNYPYNKEVDLLINELLDKYEFSNLSKEGCTCQLGKATIWVSNIPYAAITLYMDTPLQYYRPSRLTINKALDKFYKYKSKLNRSKYDKCKIEADKLRRSLF